MNNWAWFGVLELAEKYGWNPMGTVSSDGWELAGLTWYGADFGYREYWGDERRMVLLEDALNLRDALEEAFIRYEPVRLPSLHRFHLAGNSGNNGWQPAIGVIKIVSDFCQAGAFYIERI
jgi:hypothetical protein